MSSLAKQLNVLKQRDRTVTHLGKKLNASLIFDLKEAGMITAEKIKILATEGYHNLSQALPEIVNFQNLIIGEVITDRMKLTPSENQALSEELQGLLRALSKNFLNINSLRILEFLLRNYEVNRFEPDCLIISFLAYHSTGLYIKLLQNVDLSRPNSRFHFLNNTVKTGQSIQKKSLSYQVLTDPSILSDYLVYYGKTAGASPESGVFITRKMKEQMSKSPSLGFLTSLVSAVLRMAHETGRKVAEIRLISLQVISEILSLDSGAEATAATMLIFSDLSSLGLMANDQAKAVILDIWDAVHKLKMNGLYSSFSKLIAYTFQTLKILEIDQELWKVFSSEEVLESLLSLKTTLLAFLLKAFDYHVSSKVRWSKSLSKLVKHCFLNEQYLTENEQARFEVLAAMLNSLDIQDKDVKITIKGLEECVGDDIFKAVQSCLDVIGEEKQQFFEDILETSQLYQLIDIAGVSKISVAAALDSDKTKVRAKAAELLLNIESLNETVRNKLFTALEEEDDIKMIVSLVRVVNKHFAANLSISEVETLFKVLLRWEDPTINSQIRSLEIGSLRSMISCNDLISLKEVEGTTEIDFQTLKLISENSNFFESSRLEAFLKRCNSNLLSTLHEHHMILKFYLNRSSESQELVTARLIGKEVVLNMLSSLKSVSKNQFIELLNIIGYYRKVDPSCIEQGVGEHAPIFISKLFSVLLQDQSSLEAELDGSSLLEVVAALLGNLKSDQVKDSIKNLTINSLLLLIRGVQMENLHSAHFIKVLQSLRFIISQSSESTQFTEQVFSKLLKSLLSSRLEFENGVFSLEDCSKLNELKSLILEKTKEFVAFLMIFAKGCFRKSNSFAYEFAYFIRILATIDYGKRKENTGKTIYKVLSDQKVLEALCNEFEKGNEDIVIESIKAILLFTIKNSPDENVDVLLDYLKEKNGFKSFDSSFCNKLSDGACYMKILLLFFEGKPKITSYEDLKTTPEQLAYIAKEIVSDPSLETFLDYIESHISLNSAHPSVNDMQQLLLLSRYLQSRSPLTLRVRVKLYSRISKINQLLQDSKTLRLSHGAGSLETDKMKTTNIENKYITEKLELALYYSANSKAYFLDSKELYTLGFFEINFKYIMERLESYLCIKLKAVLKNSQEEGDEIFEFAAIKEFISLALRGGDFTKDFSRDLITKILDQINKNIGELNQKIRTRAEGDIGSKSLFSSLLNFEDDMNETSKVHLIKVMNSEVDYIYTELLTINAEINSKKKLALCSELLYKYLEHCEYQRTDGIIRQLISFYAVQEKKKGGKTASSPLIEDGIWNFSGFIRQAALNIFGAGNIYVVIQTLIMFYMNYSAKEGVKELPFVAFSHFLSRFLVNMDFLEQGKVQNAAIITRTLVDGLRGLGGFLPTASIRLKKLFAVKYGKKILGLDGAAESTVKLRTLRLCLYYHSFLHQFLGDHVLAKYLNSAVLEGGDNFQNSELIADLERLMDAGFDFDLQLERVQALVKDKFQSGSARVFEKLRKICKSNTTLISKFISLEIYPLFLTKRLKMIANNPEKKDFGVLYKFAQSFVERIGDSKFSVNFKQYFKAAFESFLIFVNVKYTDHTGLYGRFLNSFYSGLALVHAKAAKFVEELLEGNYHQILKVASDQKDCLVKIGCFAAIVKFSRERNEGFFPILDSFASELIATTFAMVKATDPERFTLLVDNYYVIHQERNLSFIDTLKDKLDIIAAPTTKLTNTYKNGKVAASIMAIWELLIQNMENMISPYYHTMMTTGLILDCVFEGEIKDQLKSFFLTTTEKLELRITLPSVRKQMLYLGKGLIDSKSLTFINLALSESLRHSDSTQISDNKKEIFDASRRIIKYLADSFSNLNADFFERERKAVTDTLLYFALKCSETSFKGFFEKLLKWSKLLEAHLEGDEHHTIKKLIFVKILNILVERLGKFGMAYYGYLFDYFVSYLQNAADNYSFKDTSIGKRRFSNLTSLHQELHSEIIRSIELMFAFDKIGFIDSIRFEKIVKPIAAQIAVTEVAQNFVVFGEERLLPMYVNLFSLLRDDFMLKTLQFSILSVGTRHECIASRIISAKLALRVIDKFADRYVILLNDVLPFLSEMLDDEEAGVSVVAQSIVKLLEQNTGEDIFKLIKNTQL